MIKKLFAQGQYLRWSFLVKNLSVGNLLGIIGEVSLGHVVQTIQFPMQYLEAIEAHLRTGDLLDAIVAIRTDAIMIVGGMMAIGLGVMVHVIGIARLVAHFLLSAATATGHTTEKVRVCLLCLLFAMQSIR